MQLNIHRRRFRKCRRTPQSLPRTAASCGVASMTVTRRANDTRRANTKDGASRTCGKQLSGTTCISDPNARIEIWRSVSLAMAIARLTTHSQKSVHYFPSKCRMRECTLEHPVFVHQLASGIMERSPPHQTRPAESLGSQSTGENVSPTSTGGV